MRERRDLVRVARDDDLPPGLARESRVRVAEVEPIWLRVDLQERPRLERLLDDALEVDVGGSATVQLASGQVPDAIDVRVLHGGQYAFRQVPAKAGGDPI